jgi:hypothetical protein
MITMSGKFLPFKYYGATGNAQAYGYKEEWGGLMLLRSRRHARA